MLYTFQLGKLVACDQKTHIVHFTIRQFMYDFAFNSQWFNQLLFQRFSCLIQNQNKRRCLTTYNRIMMHPCVGKNSRLKFLVFSRFERLKLTRLPRLIILPHVSPLLHQKLRKHWSLKCVYLQIVICKLLYSKECLGR